MREIKLRAWAPNCKEMWSWDRMQRVLNTLGWENFSEGEKVVMQYTGLKDKNGIEIYEGDIISDGHFAWEVCFHHGCFMAELKSHYNLTIETRTLHKTIKSRSVAKTPVKVIGNIHSNPDLLERDE